MVSFPPTNSVHAGRAWTFAEKTSSQPYLICNSTTMATDQDVIDNPEECINRLLVKLSKVETAMVASEGRANQIRKERDAEKAINEKLRKQLAKLTNDLLRKRMESDESEREIRELEEQSVGTALCVNNTRSMDRRRRISLPDASTWQRTSRRGSQDYPKDMKKLLDKRSNELLQQRQQYRIFEGRFQREAERCSKLSSDLPRLQHLLEVLVKLHKRHPNRPSGLCCYNPKGNSPFKYNMSAVGAMLTSQTRNARGCVIVLFISTLVFLCFYCCFAF